MNKNIIFSIDEETIKNFKKACIDRNKTYSEVIEGLMKEYTKEVMEE